MKISDGHPYHLHIGRTPQAPCVSSYMAYSIYEPVPTWLRVLSWSGTAILFSQCCNSSRQVARAAAQLGKGLVKLIQQVKIAHSFLQSVSSLSGLLYHSNNFSEKLSLKVSYTSFLITEIHCTIRTPILCPKGTIFNEDVGSMGLEMLPSVIVNISLYISENDTHNITSNYVSVSSLDSFSFGVEKRPSINNIIVSNNN